ncbi:MAG: hypothetical protein PHW62_06440 [Candidatus Ratteibacteria bacterium]|nr:hypothetical protein [Candidatus Ratteibacteria bacterium]
MSGLPFVVSERATKSVLQEFDDFRSRIEPSEKEKSAISASHLRLRSILENSTDINVIGSFLTGSYIRETMIKPLNDVDFFVQVHYKDHQNDTPTQLLQKLSRVLKRAYPSTPISIIPPCVVVRFDYCRFEIVPAIGITDNEEKFKIPTNISKAIVGWQFTYPRIPDNWMTLENKKADGLFKPTIKMLKRWRDSHEIPLKSFHLEMLTQMAFKNYNQEISNYAQGVLAFFVNSRALFGYFQSTPFIREPGNTGEYVDQYLYDNRSKLASVRNSLKTYCDYAERAYECMDMGSAGSAKRLWQKIFGSSFHAPSSTILTTPSQSLLPTLQEKPSSSLLESIIRSNLLSKD